MFDKKDLQNGYYIEEIPVKYNTPREQIKDTLKKLTPIERMVYCTYNINTIREISSLLKRSYSGIKSIYIRACIKINASKKG